MNGVGPGAGAGPGIGYARGEGRESGRKGALQRAISREELNWTDSKECAHASEIETDEVQSTQLALRSA